jgi:amino acid adenylation domain-containing protein
VIKLDLNLMVREEEGVVRGSLHYAKDLYERSRAERMLRHWQVVLQEIGRDAGQRIEEIGLMGEEERRQVVEEWNRSEKGAESEGWPGSVLAEIEREGERNRDGVAIVSEEERLSYGELNRRGGELGEYLRQLGVEREVVVGVYLERGIDAVIAMLGVWKAGGAYLAVEVGTPVERVGQLLEDAQTPVVVTREGLRGELPSGWMQVVSMDGEWRSRGEEPARREAAAESWGESLAYVIYTSGSTGKPKGVGIEHRQLSNYVKAVRKKAGIEAGERLAMVSTLAADLGYTMLFPGLSVGAMVHVVKPERAIDGKQMREYMEREGIEGLKITPSHLTALLGEGEGGGGIPKRRLVLGGEGCHWEWVKQMQQRRPECRMMNHYGPTECTVGALTQELGECRASQGNIPLGRPLEHMRAYVMDGRGEAVGIGMTGELYLGGRGVGRGYIGRGGMTAERFVPDGYSGGWGERMYRTGDLGRWREDGVLEFLGRVDEQVKIRGYRIEPGEIEEQLKQVEGVEASAVVARPGPGGMRLVGYVVGGGGRKLEEAELKRQLGSKLPGYMVPARVLVLERLPLNANGKLDRRSLPEVDWAGEERGGEAESAVEEIVSGIWGEVLGVERPGREENFFELGGHSLLATQVVSRLRKVFEVELPPRKLFEGPTVKEVARAIEELRAGGRKLKEPEFVRAERGQGMPLSYAQQRLWFMERLEGSSGLWNIPAGVRMRGRLELEAVRWSLSEIVRRHEVLRTVFEEREGGTVVQVVQEVEKVEVPLVELKGEGIKEREAEAREWAEREAEEGFDLGRGPLLRARVLRLGEQDHVLLVTMHHIVSDGWSNSLLVEEFVGLYEGWREGSKSPLEELPWQYGDYAVWQRKWLQGEVLEEQLSYWREKLKGMGVLEVPGDRVRPAKATHQGGSVEFRLSEELSEGLKRLSRVEGVTLYMMLLGCFQVLLSRYSGEQDVVVGTDVANRNRVETEKLIGFFVNQVVLRTEVGGNPSFREMLGRVRKTALEAWAHQDLPFERLVEELAPARDLSRAPLFQVKLVLRNEYMRPLELPGLEICEMGGASNLAKLDLTLFFSDDGRSLSGLFEYNVELFEKRTILNLQSSLIKIFTKVVKDPTVLLSELFRESDIQAAALFDLSSSLDALEVGRN